MKLSKEFYISLPILIAAISIIFSSSLQKKLRDSFQENDKEILSTITTRLDNTNQMYKIIKVLENKKISIELFKFDSNQMTYKFVDELSLSNRKDAFFKVGKNTSNIFTLDLDKDGSIEIIAPTIGENAKPRLHVLNFNSDLESLQRSSIGYLSY